MQGNISSSSKNKIKKSKNHWYLFAIISIVLIAYGIFFLITNNEDSKLDQTSSQENQIVTVKEDSNVKKDDNIRITIAPGLRIDQIKESFIKQGFRSKDVEVAFLIDNYKNNPLFTEHELLTDSLEGYLFPETFFIDEYDLQSAQSVVRRSLEVMHEKLISQVFKDKLIENVGSLRRAIILASIVEKEVDNNDRTQVAQVFLNRLKTNQRIDSDVTFFYAHAIGDGPAHPSNPSLYNTRVHRDLPPGPISNVSLSSLQAVANPTQGDYMFFVVCDNGKTVFSRTLAEHQNSVDRCCDENCRLPQSYFFKDDLRQLIYIGII